MGLRIVTDSTAYLSKEILDEYQIKVVPLSVHFENESFKEGERYTNREFYERLRKADSVPTTSQPSVGDFRLAFQEVGNSGESVIAILMSSRLSGTFNAAQLAAQSLPELDIAVIDSRSAAMGLGFQVLAAVQAARMGLKKDEVIAKIEKVREGMTINLLVDTLEYLRRGGRIGGAQALIGTILQMKPILCVNKEGIVDVFEKVRTKHKAVERLLELFKTAYEKDGSQKVAVIHVDAIEEGRRLAALVKEITGKEPEFQEAGPVIGGHVGPGTVALCYYPQK